jgi:subtilisin family serine protease
MQGRNVSFTILRRALGVFAILILAVGLPATPGGADPGSGPTRHIVLLDDSANPRAVAAEHGRRYGAEVKGIYEHAVKGYVADFRGTGASDVARDSRVRLVERDGVVAATTIQTGAPWGLDRIDQPTSLLSGSFSYTNTGAGVTAYIIDTGIRLSHSDFGGRAVTGFDAVDGGPADDCNGHGTHVAGTVGGSTYGVAKGVSLVAVRVLGCDGNGTTSGVITGIDWVTANHTAGAPAVANMSLGGSASSALDAAVSRSIADGVTYAVAAGNGNAGGVAQDACKSSPARVAAAITVGATDSTDRKASWSNYGKCVDWFAPGVGITSAWYTGDSATNTISGTSMATPHTAGVAALYLQASPATSPSTLRNALLGLTVKGIVTSAKTTNNHLLFTNL